MRKVHNAEIEVACDNFRQRLCNVNQAYIIEA
jgi:hypothetical protein